MTSVRPCFSSKSFGYIHTQRNHHLQLFNGCFAQMAIQDINQTLKGDVCWNIVLRFT